jgi:hypothetical protein
MTTVGIARNYKASGAKRGGKPDGTMSGDTRAQGRHMEPVTLVVTALAAGAGLSPKDTASTASIDAYIALKALARKKLAGCHEGQLILKRHGHAPDIWQAPLAAEFAAAGAGTDTALITAAGALMTLIDLPGTRAGKYAVNADHSQGLQIGDGNTQHYTYVNTQIVHSPAAPPKGADNDLSGQAKRRNRPRPRRRKKKQVAISADESDPTPPPIPDISQRMETAATLAQRDRRAGAELYALIARDKRVDASTRMQAAAHTAALDPSVRAKYAYQGIVTDSAVHIDTRMQAAAALTEISQIYGRDGYRKISADTSVDINIRLQAADAVSQISPIHGAAAYKRIYQQ